MRRVRRRHILIFLAGLVGLCLLAGLVYYLPPVHERLAPLPPTDTGDPSFASGCSIMVIETFVSEACCSISS